MAVINHQVTGSKTNREAGSVKRKSLAGIGLNASPVERLVIVVACAATVVTTTFESRWAGFVLGQKRS